MDIFENIRVGLQAIRANKLRSILTALIIAIGIMALVGILTCIKGIEKNITKNFATMGANSFNIRNRGMNIRIGRSGERPKDFPAITYDQAMAFKNSFTFSDIVSVSDILSGSSTVKYEEEETDPNVQLIGGDEDWALTSGYGIGIGRSISPNELRYSSNVVVIGSEVHDRLFEGRDPINEIITIGGNQLRVIGVFKEKGDAIIGPGDRFCLIPISKAKQLTGSQNSNYTVTVNTANPQTMDGTIGEATALFRNIRKLNTKEENNFEITTSDSFANTLIESLKNINYATIAIGAITLFGAAIALMNIMLVSVTERTREIGVRKSIGATSIIIRRQFLFEAVIICLLGGIAGILMGMGIGNVLSTLIGGTFVIPWGPIFMGITLCVGVGIASGLYPAIKASRLDPVEALRYE